MYRLRIRKSVSQAVDRLLGHVRQRVRRLIDGLAANPTPPDAKELRDLPGYYRICLDRWRVIYRLDAERQEVTVLSVRRKTGPATYADMADNG